MRLKKNISLYFISLTFLNISSLTPSTSVNRFGVTFQPNGYVLRRILPTTPLLPIEMVSRRYTQSSSNVPESDTSPTINKNFCKKTSDRFKRYYQKHRVYKNYYRESCVEDFKNSFIAFINSDQKGWKTVIGPGTIAAVIALLSTDNSNDNSQINDLEKRTAETEEKNQDIIRRRGLEMINWSGLYTNSQYLPARLEENDRDLDQAILKVTNLERELAGFRRKKLHGLLFFSCAKEDDNNQLFSFSFPWKRTKVARALELKEYLTAQKSELEVARYANRVLQSIQSKNRTGPQGAQESMEQLIRSLRSCASKTHRNQEELRLTILKVLNLRAILHLETIEYEKPDKGDIEGALSLFNTIIRDSKNDPRISSVYCNKGFFLYSYLGDLTNAEEALKGAHQLSAADPLILMHLAQCEFRMATYTPPTLENQVGESRIAPTRVTPEVLEEKVFNKSGKEELYKRKEKYKQAQAFIDQSANRGYGNYLIHQVKGKLLPKFLSIDGAVEDPLDYNGGALEEFMAVHRLLQDKSNEIKDGLDVYYYYPLARVHAVRREWDLALRYFEHARAYLAADYKHNSVFFFDTNEILEHAIEITKDKRNKTSEKVFLRDLRTLSLYDIWQVSLNFCGWSKVPSSSTLSREEECAYRIDLLERDIDIPLYGFYFVKPEEFAEITPRREINPPRDVFGGYAKYAAFAEIPKDLFSPSGKTDAEQLSSRIQQLLAILK